MVCSKQWHRRLCPAVALHLQHLAPSSNYKLAKYKVTSYSTSSPWTLAFVDIANAEMPWYSSILRLVVPWWQPVHVPDAARRLLQNYSGISEDEIEQHVKIFVR